MKGLSKGMIYCTSELYYPGEVVLLTRLCAVVISTLGLYLSRRVCRSRASTGRSVHQHPQQEDHMRTATKQNNLIMKHSTCITDTNDLMIKTLHLIDKRSAIKHNVNYILKSEGFGSCNDFPENKLVPKMV